MVEFCHLKKILIRSFWPLKTAEKNLEIDFLNRKIWRFYGNSAEQYLILKESITNAVLEN